MAILISILIALGYVSSPDTGNNCKDVKQDTKNILTTGYIAAITQSWYSVGTVYQFESKSAVNPQEVITFRVVYNAQGDAAITKSTRAATSQDKQKIFSFGPQQELMISFIQGQTNPTVYTYSTNNKYWIIPFDNYVSLAMPGTETTITSTCFGSDGSCDVSTIIDNGGTCSTCVPGANCINCKMNISNSTFANTGGVLFIKTNNVSLL